MNKNPLVSIITVNYNQTKVTLEFLESIQKISYSNYEVIVVDNASPTDSPDEILIMYPWVHLIKLNKNLGFAGGNNVGVRAAKGEYFLFLNNDTEVDPDFIQPMLELFFEDETIGMISPKIRFYHTPDTIQYAGYTPMNALTLRQNLIGYRQVDTGQFDVPESTYAIHGAAMMVPLKVVKQVGLMAEIFFLYYEEHDWCAQVKKAGYQVYYQPKSLVFHKESISTGKESPLKTYYIARNRVLYARRNSVWFVFLLNFLYLSIVTIPKATIQYIIQRKFNLLRAFYRAMFWNITNYKRIHENIKL